jgi:hypothetical protein
MMVASEKVSSNINEGGRVELKADAITKDYLSDTTIFADVFNYYIHDGEQVIRPEQLEERDPTAIALPYGADGASVPVQKFRDVQKLYTAMTDGKREYILYGLESQAGIHYAAPVKNNLYDAIEYASQVEEAARSHRNAMKAAKRKANGDTEQQKPNSDEFLSGFWKSDRLIPSITVMIYFEADRWDGPLSLFEMMDVEDSEILRFMNDYKINLIAPAQMTDEEIMKFQTSLREVLLFIKYSKDKESLNRIVKANEKRFREVERRAADVIKAVTNANLRYEESGVEVDMCQALQEMQMEARQQGLEQGQTQGKLIRSKEVARNFYKMGLDVEKIAQGVGYDVETVKGWVIYSDDTQD